MGEVQEGGRGGTRREELACCLLAAWSTHAFKNSAAHLTTQHVCSGSGFRLPALRLLTRSWLLRLLRPSTSPAAAGGLGRNLLQAACSAAANKECLLVAKHPGLRQRHQGSDACTRQCEWGERRHNMRG